MRTRRSKTTLPERVRATSNSEAAAFFAKEDE